MSKLKETQNPRQAWTTLLLVIAVSAFFAFIVLPYIRPKSPLEGVAAPDFALGVIHGGDVNSRIRLSDLRGKTVILDFWASWCGPCRVQAPIVDTIARRHESAGDVVVVGVSTSDERNAAIQFARGANLSYPMVFDDGNRVAAAYSVTGLPTLVIVDQAGKIVSVRRSVVREPELEELIGLAQGR
jgi:thiol-disulfide isomerase/thioredoxin